MPGQDIPPFALGTSDLFDMTNNKQGYIYLHEKDGFTFLENVPEKPTLCTSFKGSDDGMRVINCHFPEESSCPCGMKWFSYVQSRLEAIEKRMVIGNPEVIKEMRATKNDWKHDNTHGIELTGWPGTWKITFGCDKCGAHYSPEPIQCENGYCEKRKVVILSPPKEERNEEEIKKQFDWMTPEKAERLSKPVNSSMSEKEEKKTIPERIYEHLGDGYGFNGPKEKAVEFIKLLVGDLTRSAYAQGYIDKTERRGMKYLEWQSKTEPVVSQDQPEIKTELRKTVKQMYDNVPSVQSNAYNLWLEIRGRLERLSEEQLLNHIGVTPEPVAKIFDSLRDYCAGLVDINNKMLQSVSELEAERDKLKSENEILKEEIQELKDEMRVQGEINDPI